MNVRQMAHIGQPAMRRKVVLITLEMGEEDSYRTARLVIYTTEGVFS